MQRLDDCLKDNKNRREKEYFIDKDGKIHKYNGNLREEIVSMHNHIAVELFPEIEKAKDFIMKLGWIMIGSSVYHLPIIHQKPTQAQINTLYDLELYDKLTFLHNGYYINYVKYELLCD